GLPREDREMRMVLEQPGGGLVGVGANHGEGAERIADVRNAVRRDPLRRAERPAQRDEHILVLLDPGLPAGHALALASAAFILGQRLPFAAALAILVAKEDGEIPVSHSACSWHVMFVSPGYIRASDNSRSRC